MRLSRFKQIIFNLFKRLRLPLNALVITAIAFGLSHWIAYDLTSISAFAPMEKTLDFDFTDVYNTVAEQRAKRTLSDDIVIVSIDGCSREGITEALDYVDYLNPAAIGLDVFFNYPAATDLELISSLTQCPNLVFPVGLQMINGHASIFGSYFYDDISIEHKGVVNLSANSVRNVIRDFEPEYIVGNDTIRSFSAELARVAAPEKFEALMARGRSKETINYPSWEFEIIPAVALSNGDITLEEVRQSIEGKVVLIGNIFDQSDFHLTPIDEGMAGLLIHARALQTILDSCYIEETSEAISWVMAIALSFIFILLVLVIKKRCAFEGCFVRFLQLALMYAFLALGCNVFAHRGDYLNFAPTLLMFGLGMFAMDIWLGFLKAVKIHIHKNRKR